MTSLSLSPGPDGFDYRSRSGILGRYVPFCWEGVAYGLPPTRLQCRVFQHYLPIADLCDLLTECPGEELPRLSAWRTLHICVIKHLLDLRYVLALSRLSNSDARLLGEAGHATNDTSS